MLSKSIFTMKPNVHLYRVQFIISTVYCIWFFFCYYSNLLSEEIKLKSSVHLALALTTIYFYFFRYHSNK